MDALAARSRYHPDGGLKPAWLPVLMLVPLVVGVVEAWFQKLLFDEGTYMFLLVPLIGAAFLSAIMMRLCTVSHCRNPLVVAIIGGLAGAVYYLGYFHFYLLDFLPPGNAGRIDLLLEYLYDRITIDSWTGRPRSDADLNVQVVCFKIELICCVAIPALQAWKSASRPYSRVAGDWYQQEIFLIPFGKELQFIQALNAGTLRDVLPDIPESYIPATSVLVAVDYADPHEGSPLESPVYITVQDPAQRKRWLPSGADRLNRVALVELIRQEVLTIAPRLSRLRERLELERPELEQFSM